MTPAPSGQPKPQSSQQPGNEPGGANGMYGRFGQTPGQQPSQGFRQKVDGMRRGFGGRQQRGGMRQANGMGQMQSQANAQQADRSQEQGREAYSNQLRSFHQPDQPEQPIQQPDYGRFAPGPAADAPSGDMSAQQRAAANPFGGDGYSSGRFGSAFGNAQQPVQQPSGDTSAQQPSGSFASPFGMMRSNMPAAPAQPKPDDTQPRDTFQTGQSSLTQPLHSLEGQSRQRQRDRFGYGA